MNPDLKNQFILIYVGMFFQVPNILAQKRRNKEETQNRQVNGIRSLSCAHLCLIFIEMWFLICKTFASNPNLSQK